MSQENINTVWTALCAILFFYFWSKQERRKGELLNLMYKEERNYSTVRLATKIKYNSARLWSCVYLLSFAIFISRFFNSFY